MGWHAKWSQVRLVQFHLYDQMLANTILDDDAELSRTEGNLPQEIPQEQVEVRTPITVTPGSSIGQAPSDRDDESVGDDVFWAQWMEEMKSDPPDEKMVAEIDDDLATIHSLSEPPDPTYYEEPTLFCYQYLHAFEERYARPPVNNSQKGKWQQDVDREMDI